MFENIDLVYVCFLQYAVFKVIVGRFGRKMKIPDTNINYNPVACFYICDRQIINFKLKIARGGYRVQRIDYF